MLAVYDAVSQALQANEHEEIDMVGHSRGGAIVIWAAWTLLHDPPMSPCGRKLGANIHFMGLYDAVNMYLWVSTDRIPPNVGYVAHARRDPADGSRSSWGNTGTSGGQHYTEKFFWCTHSGMGGDPWGGDHPSQMTEQQDKENSPKVDAWIRNMQIAINAGILSLLTFIVFLIVVAITRPGIVITAWITISWVVVAAIVLWIEQH